MNAVRVVGLGQPEAGDDGVGWVVLDALAGRVPPGVDLVRTSDAAVLVDAIAQVELVVVVDALCAGQPGRVLCLASGELDRGPAAVSTHGISVPQAIALGRALTPDGAAVQLVGITIDRPTGAARGLSPPVAAAVEPAAAQVLALLASPREPAAGAGRQR